MAGFTDKLLDAEWAGGTIGLQMRLCTSDRATGLPWNSSFPETCLLWDDGCPLARLSTLPQGDLWDLCPGCLSVAAVPLTLWTLPGPPPRRMEMVGYDSRGDRAQLGTLLAIASCWL